MTNLTAIPGISDLTQTTDRADDTPKDTSHPVDTTNLTTIYNQPSQQGLTEVALNRNKKAKDAVSGTSPLLNAQEATKKVDKALFNAYLRRLEVLLEQAASENASEALTQIIKLSMSYTVSIRSEETYRLFVSSIVLIVRNNFSSLEDMIKVSSLKEVLLRFSNTQRTTKDYDAFMKACYMLGLSSLNRP